MAAASAEDGAASEAGGGAGSETGGGGSAALTGRAHAMVATPAQAGQQADHSPDVAPQSPHTQAGMGGASRSRRRQTSAARAEPPGSRSSISAISRHPSASASIFNAAMR